MRRAPLILALLAAAVAFVFAVSLAHAQSSPDTPGSIDVGGVTRTYVAHLPSPLPAHPGLVLWFHGHGGTGAGQMRMAHLDGPADAAGFIVVSPDGIDRSWNDGRAQTQGADDVAFVKALIADFSRRYAIDHRRIFATGFSNGAILTQYLGCTLASQLAAIAPVSGYLPVDDLAACHPSRPISVLEIGGRADPIVPYDGGKIGYLGNDRGEVLSASATIAFWAKNAHCGAPMTTPIVSTVPPDGTSVEQTVYQDCVAGTTVKLFSVRGAGHTWPGGPQYLPARYIGAVSGQIDASAYIIDFFVDHPLK
jgi:polyhydroxybutyrate depolymerase